MKANHTHQKRSRLHFNTLRPGPSMFKTLRDEATNGPIPDIDKTKAPFAYLNEAYRGDEPDPETGEVRIWGESEMGEYDPVSQVWRFPVGESYWMGMRTRTRGGRTRSSQSPPTASYQGERPDYANDDTGFVTDDACF